MSCCVAGVKDALARDAKADDVEAHAMREIFENEAQLGDENHRGVALSPCATGFRSCRAARLMLPTRPAGAGQADAARDHVWRVGALAGSRVPGTGRSVPSAGTMTAEPCRAHPGEFHDARALLPLRM
jgi:hypothetical protein